MPWLSLISEAGLEEVLYVHVFSGTVVAALGVLTLTSRGHCDLGEEPNFPDLVNKVSGTHHNVL